jgi:predicted dienelactone hydrolase
MELGYLNDSVYLTVMWRSIKTCLLALLLASTLCSCSRPGAGSSVAVDTARNRSIEYTVAAPALDQPAPLILVSHGTGGHFSDHTWLIDSLVADGYIVAALNHPNDTRQDSSLQGLVRAWDRPADISFLLSHLIASSEWGNRIDPTKVGAVGFSSGGYTVIALAGASYEPELMKGYCASAHRGPDCDLAKGVVVDWTDAQINNRDARIRAVFAMAPALGPAITASSLQAIGMPVSIVAAEDDELVPPRYHAMRYAENISSAELVMLPKGGHFVFLECTFITSIVDFFMEDYNLCGKGIDVDRTDVQDGIKEMAGTFFNQALKNS